MRHLIKHQNRFQEQFSLTYIPQLDGLRGIAILIVMLFHAQVPLLQGGFIGVDIFFVLSGFLITSLLVAEFDRCGSISLKKFYIRRVLRLAPALITLLTIFCISSALFLSTQQAHDHYIDAIISLAYFSNWARAFDLHPPDFLGHTWSLSIEEQFYIYWPILLFVMLRFSKNRRSVVILSILIAVFSWALRAYLHANGATIERLYNGLDTRADALMLGCAFGVAFSSGFFEKNTQLLSKVLAITAPVAVLCLLGFSVFAQWRDSYLYDVGFFVIEILAVILIINVVIQHNSVIKKFLDMKLLVWSGSISYGLYLWHYLIYRVMFALGFNWVVVAIIGSAITFIAAALSYYVIEKPILKLKKQFIHTTSPQLQTTAN